VSGLHPFSCATCQDFVVIRVGGVTTAVVAAATAACGLLMLGGVGPTPAAADDVAVPAAPVVAAGAAEPASTGSTTTDAAPPVVADVDQSSTSTPTTTTTTPTTTTVEPAPIPLSVAPETLSVGVGGVARISGEVPVIDCAPLGPVEIWQIGSTVTPISTGVTAASWSYDWTAPTEVEPLVLQIWCGDPSQYAGGYPEALQIEVVFVDQAPASASTTVATEPDHVIPETG
jgi:hypothetical protein